jgi:arginyl-tRNA synthetase
MLVEHLRDEYPQILSVKNNDDDDDTTETATTKKNLDLGDLVEFYKAAKKRFDADEDFKQRARNAVVRLQSRQDPTAVAAWEALCAASRVEYKSIYNTLNIDDRLIERGESFYNPYLPEIVQDLESKGYAVESDGALAVFVDGYANRDGTPFPLIVRKSDGGYNYATTDLAAIRHRCSQMESDGGELADRVLYVTDAGQAQHFDMVFAVARKAGFVPEHVSLEHVPFGLVQGEDGKKFATRSGETVKLKDLLNEAVRIAGKDLRERAQDTDDPAFIARAEKVAQIVGIGAVKYADLSMNRESNYRFSYERMLSLNGNTAPYMLYAYARLCGIIRKATGQAEPNSTDGMAIVAVEWPLPASKIILSHDSEIELARALVKLPDVISEVEHNLYPNRMCDYLYDVSVKFNQFYENCSVKNAETPDLRASRLSLCTATAGVMRLLMTLLGLEVVEKL